MVFSLLWCSRVVIDGDWCVCVVIWFLKNVILSIYLKGLLYWCYFVRIWFVVLF